jgi:serine/threonine protein kinase/WD40 repeat protein
MSHEPELPRQLPGESTPGEATICFDGSAQLPETTMAFDSPSQELPDSVHYPSVMNYTAKEEVGRGGMAKIFLADDLQLKRLVAIKVSTADTSVPDTLFQAEAEVLSNLAHPNIPPIHSCGIDDVGRAFYSTKLICGQTLQKILKQLAAGDPDITASFTLPRLLEIFRKVCDGVAFAHAKGFLHRDLKPENIMVGEFGEVLVMDWGLALAFEKNVQTQHQQVPQSPQSDTGTIRLQGTPQYMSPEQAEGMVDGLDERSDVYALGGVLHAILTLQSPVSGRSIQEVLDRVRDGQIAPIPNARVIEGVAGKITVPIPEALRAVARKAMATCRTDRYSDVTALVADIEAYQSGFATSAEQAGFLRQLTLLVKRNRAASFLVAALVMVAGAFTVRLAQSEKLSRLRALEAQENAAAALTEKKAARRSAADAQMAIAEVWERENNFTDLRRTLQMVPEELRDQNWGYLDERLNGDALTVVSKTGNPWHAVQPILGKAGMVAALEQDGTLCLINLNTGGMHDLIRVNPVGLAQMLAMSPNGSTAFINRIVQKPKNAPPKAPQLYAIEAYDTTDNRLKYSIPTPAESDLIVVNSTCDFFGRNSYDAGGTFAIHDAATGARLWEKTALGYFIPWFSENGDTVHLFTMKQGYLQLDVRTGQNRAGPISAVYPSIVGGYERNISVSPNGADAFLPSKEGFDIIETRTGKLRYNVQLPLGGLTLKRIDADWKNQLLYAAYRKTEHEVILHVLSSRDGRKVHSFGFSIPAFVRRLDIFVHPLSNQLIATSDKYIKAWGVQAAVGFKRFELSPRIPEPIAQGFCFLEDSKHCLTYLLKNHGKFLTVHDLNPESTQETPFEAAGQINGNFGVNLSTSSDGRILSVANRGIDNKEYLHLYENQNGAFKPLVKKEITVIRNRYQMAPLHMSPSGKTIWHAGAFRENSALKVTTSTDRNGHFFPEGNANSRWVGDSHFVEMASPRQAEATEDENSLDRVLLLYSSAGGKPLSTTSARQAVGLAAAPDGSRIAEAGSDMRLRIRDAQTLKVLRELRTHDAPLTAVAWHPSLPYVATASEDHRVKIWDLRTEKAVKKIGFFAGIPSNLLWSPDGKTLAVQSVGESYFVDLFKIDCCNE